MYVAIKSAHVHNPEWKIHLYITRDCEPVGPWYTRLLSELNISIEEVEDFNYIFDRPIEYFTHKTDVIRIQKLIEHGGVYLDLDTITIDSFEKYRMHKYVTCIEDDSWRFGSAVLMSEQNSVFAKEIIELYRTFRSTGRDEYFVETIQENPYQLWKQKYLYSDEVIVIPADEILSPKTLQDYKGNQIYFMKFFETDEFDLSGKTVLHLWTELNYQKYIKDLNSVLSSNTTFSNLIRKYI